MKNRLIFLLLLTLLAGGCAAQGQRAETLLATDHAALSDQELIDYFQRLNGEIARQKRLLREERRGADEARQQALWERWNEVRTEMGRRELLP